MWSSSKTKTHPETPLIERAPLAKQDSFTPRVRIKSERKVYLEICDESPVAVNDDQISEIEKDQVPAVVEEFYKTVLVNAVENANFKTKNVPFGIQTPNIVNGLLKSGSSKQIGAVDGNVVDNVLDKQKAFVNVLTTKSKFVRQKTYDGHVIYRVSFYTV